MPQEKNDAIQQDASSIPDLNDPNLKLDRASAMAAMAARRRNTVLNDMDPEAQQELIASRAAPETKPLTEDDNADDAAAERARAELEAAQAVAGKKYLDEEPAKDEPVLTAKAQVAVQDNEDIILTDDELRRVKIRTKVNGEERLLTGDELRVRAQKVDAADDYLATAKDLLRQAHAARTQEPAATPVAQAPEALDLSEIDTAIDAVFAGQDESAKENLKKALLKLQGATPANLQQQAREMEQFLVTRSELRQFAKDHKDIIDDKIARRIADEFVLQGLAEAGVKRLEDLPPDRIHDVLERAAEQTKPYLPNKSPAASPGSTATTLSERLKRKAQIDELPSAAARGSSSEPPAKTTRDILNDMRKARGQPAL